MQKRIIKALYLNNFSDQIFGITYLKIITFTSVEEVKLPCSLEKYKYKHLLNPRNILKIELVKTRKNWIVNQIIDYETFCSPKNFSDFYILAQCIEELNQNLKINQQVDTLSFFLEYLNENNLEKLNLEDFRNKLTWHLGFGLKQGI